MLKVFLVEDEYIIRESIRRAVDWNAAGFEFVGEAGDGERAYPQILLTEPDIVITDIRMPFMDGLELSRLVLKKRPSTKILILSGFDDFTYAREAISIGVAEYLLKPVSGAKLLEALKAAARQIEEERSQFEYKEIYEAEHAERVKLEKQRFMKQVMGGKLSMAEALEKAQELQIDLTAEFYTVVLIQVMSKQSRDSGKIEELSSEVLDAAESIIRLAEQIPYIGLYEQIGGTLCMLVMGNSRDELKMRVQAELDQAAKCVDDSGTLFYCAAIGEPVERIREIRKSFHTASRLFARRFVQESSCVFSFDDPEESSEDGKGDENPLGGFSLSGFDIGKIDRRIVYNFLRSATTDDAEDFAEQCWRGIGVRNMSSQLVRQYIIMDVYLSTASFLSSSGISAEEIEASCGTLVDPVKLTSPEAMKDYFVSLFHRAICLRDKRTENRYGTMVAEAKQYIYRNFSENSISLGSVAEAVGVSPNHLSRLFSQETGETFVEFLTEVRMERARDLLTSTQIPNAEIGTRVGYSDPHYFYYIFKKTQNMTPKEYRSASSGKEG